MVTNRITMLGTTLAVVLTSAGVAVADMTYVANPWLEQPGSQSAEWNLYDNGSGRDGIMEYLYGSYTRVDDDFDQVWYDPSDGTEPVEVVVEAKFAGYGQTLGWYDATNDVSHTLLSQGAQLSPLGGTGAKTSFTVGADVDMVWWDDTTSSGGSLYFSQEWRNPGARDHMVTFRVDGAYTDFTDPNNPTGWEAFTDGEHYVIAFEDLDLGDRDYNDMVVEVTIVQPVPAPAAALLGLIGLGSAGWFRRRRA